MFGIKGKRTPIQILAWTVRYLIIGILLFSMIGCGGNSQTSEPPSATPAPPSLTPLPPTDTPVPPTATSLPTQIPSDTPIPLPSETATKTPPPATIPVDRAILVYYVQINQGTPQKTKANSNSDKKPKLSCTGQSLVYINTGMARSGNVEQDVRTALNRLFTYHSPWVGALRNPLYASTFAVSSIEFASSGTVTVKLTGSYVKSSDRCDKGWVRNQIWSTIRQFKGITTVQVYLNSALLGDVLAVNG